MQKRKALSTAPLSSFSPALRFMIREVRKELLQPRLILAMGRFFAFSPRPASVASLSVPPRGCCWRLESCPCFGKRRFSSVLAPIWSAIRHSGQRLRSFSFSSSPVAVGFGGGAAEEIYEDKRTEAVKFESPSLSSAPRQISIGGEGRRRPT